MKKFTMLVSLVVCSLLGVHDGQLRRRFPKLSTPVIVRVDNAEGLRDELRRAREREEYLESGITTSCILGGTMGTVLTGGCCLLAGLMALNSSLCLE